ncbi:MAG: hypothetical protein IIY58_01615 [Aeriscardovia sp.]|nr:hypothetical protein [Aeriscardovia sp.]
MEEEPEEYIPSTATPPFTVLSWFSLVESDPFFAGKEGADEGLIFFDEVGCALFLLGAAAAFASAPIKKLAVKNSDRITAIILTIYIFCRFMSCVSLY